MFSQPGVTEYGKGSSTPAHSFPHIVGDVKYKHNQGKKFPYLYLVTEFTLWWTGESMFFRFR